MILVMTTDGNSMVRRELLMFFSAFIFRYKTKFLVAAFEQLSEEVSSEPPARKEDRGADGLYMKTRTTAPATAATLSSCSQNTIYAAIWRETLVMSTDPHPEIAKDASIVVDYILIALLQSPLSKFTQPQFDELIKRKPVNRSQRRTHEERPVAQSPEPRTPSKEASYLSLFGGLRRTTSFAASIKGMLGSHDPPLSPQKSPNRARTEEANGPPVGSHAHAPEKHHVEEQPKTRGFVPRSLATTPELPLVSRFFDWSVEYFREPQMKPSEADEPGSADYNGRLWRRNRNDKIIAETQPLKEVAVTHQWTHQHALFDNQSQPMKICFHQFEEHVVVADNRDTINVVEYTGGPTKRLNSFSNGNPMDSKITEVKFINEDDQALLMTGSSDGIIKIFRNYDTRGKTELVTAFRALTDLVSSNKNAGLVFDWQQGRGLVLVAGDVRVIRVWNAGTEVCTSVSYHRVFHVLGNVLTLYRTYLHAPAPASHLLPQTRSKATSSSPASATAQSASTTSARSPQQPWSKSGKNTSNGSQTCTSSAAASANSSAAAATAKSNSGTFAWTSRSRPSRPLRIISKHCRSTSMRPCLRSARSATRSSCSISMMVVR
jgi:regulator-associated protein of mTOR